MPQLQAMKKNLTLFNGSRGKQAELPKFTLNTPKFKFKSP